MALAEDDGRGQEEVKDEEAKAKAVIAAKTGNLSVSLGNAMIVEIVNCYFTQCTHVRRRGVQLDVRIRYIPQNLQVWVNVELCIAEIYRLLVH